MQRAAFASILLILATSCATGPKTASGRPEIRVRLDAKTAKARLADRYASQGYNIEASDDLGFTISQPLGAFEEAMVGPGTHRIRFNLSESAGITTIRATTFVFSKGANTETSTGKAGAQTQQKLESIFAAESIGQGRAPVAMAAQPVAPKEEPVPIPRKDDGMDWRVGDVLQFSARSKLHGRIVTIESIEHKTVTVRAVDSGDTDAIEVPFLPEVERARALQASKGNARLQCINQ